MVERPRNKQVLVDWIKDCATDEDKEKRLVTLVSSVSSMKVLASILHKRREAGCIKVADYDNPSWSHKMADSIGYTRAIDEVLKLIDSLDHITTKD